MDISFLANQPKHVNQIAQWYFDEWASASPGSSVEKVAQAVGSRAISRYQLPLALVAHELDKLLGVAELKFHENKNYPEYEHWLGGVFVDPKCRGKGIAGLLISSALKHVSKLGIKELYLQCESHNIGLYKHYQFTTLHEDKFSSESVTIMVWKE